MISIPLGNVAAPTALFAIFHDNEAILMYGADIFSIFVARIKKHITRNNHMSKVIDNNDTKELIEFYKMGLDSIIQGEYSITCYDGKDPSWEHEGYLPFTEYIVVIDKTDIINYQKTIESFFGVTSFVPNNNKLFFGCGNKTVNPDSKMDEVLQEKPKKENENNSGFEIITHAILPSYLDELIYGEFFGAKYQPDHQRYEYNLDLTEEELLIYLGTYFPRSFGESLCLFLQIIKTETINSGLNRKDCINILDIGCGSGGEILGLLHILDNNNESNIPINIYSFDGNQLVQDILMELVSQFQNATKTKRRIQIYTNVQRIDGISDVETIKTNIGGLSFDFILCNKMCNELISRGHIKDAYLLMCNSFTSFLDSTGLFLILDVTTKDEKSSRFFPELLNEQVNKFVTGHSKEFSTMLPISCALHPECMSSCFTQRRFYISHSQKQNDMSKVAYRIIARKTLCEKFMKEIGNVKEIVNESVKDAGDSASCPLT